MRRCLGDNIRPGSCDERWKVCGMGLGLFVRREERVCQEEEGLFMLLSAVMSCLFPVNDSRKFNSSCLSRNLKLFFIHKRVLIIDVSESENLYISLPLNFLKCSISPFHRQFRGNYQEKIDLSYEDGIHTLPCKPRVCEVSSGIICSTPNFTFSVARPLTFENLEW